MPLSKMAKIAAGLALSTLVTILGLVIFLATRDTTGPVPPPPRSSPAVPNPPAQPNPPAPANPPAPRVERPAGRGPVEVQVYLPAGQGSVSERDFDDLKRLDRIEANQDAALKKGAK